MQELEYGRGSVKLFTICLTQDAYCTVSSALNTSRKLSLSVSSGKGISEKSTENVQLLALGRFALTSVIWIILVGGSGLWNVVLGEESGLDASFKSTEVSQNLFTGVSSFWITSLEKALMILTRNQDEWCLKDYNYLKNEPFSSPFLARFFFFFNSSLNTEQKNFPNKSNVDYRWFHYSCVKVH